VAVSEGLDQRHVQLDEPSPGALVPTVTVSVDQSAGGRISVGAEASGHDVLHGAAIAPVTGLNLNPILRVRET